MCSRASRTRRTGKGKRDAPCMGCAVREWEGLVSTVSRSITRRSRTSPACFGFHLGARSSRDRGALCPYYHKGLGHAPSFRYFLFSGNTEGSYYLEWWDGGKRYREGAGPNAFAAVEKMRVKQAELDAVRNGVIPATPIIEVAPERTTSSCGFLGQSVTSQSRASCVWPCDPSGTGYDGLRTAGG
jgi:hypothetical protein